MILVDSNYTFCQMFVDYISFYPEFELVGIYQNGVEAVRGYRALNPHIIVVDMMTPLLDWPNFIDIVKNRQRGHESIVIVLSAFSREFFSENASGLGADCFVAKPFGLNILINCMLNMRGKKGKGSIDNKQIGDLLIREGIDSNLLGYFYCVEAVQYLFKLSPRSTRGLGNQIYENLSAAHGKTISSVERAMRYAISNRAFETASESNIAFVFKAYQKLLNKG